MPPYTTTTADPLGPRIRLVDPRYFIWQYEAIFARQEYRLVAKRPDPRILDCGANIDLMSIYWKQAYSAARITAFEPDSEVFEVFSANVAQLDLSDIELVEAAVWTDAGELPY